MIFFVFGLLKPTKNREWWPFAAFSLFVVSFFFEMYGYPLTSLMTLDWVAPTYPDYDRITPDRELLLRLLIGGYAGALRKFGLILSAVGLLAIVWAWQVLLRAQQHHEVASDRPYASIRHPEYAGLFLTLFGIVLKLPTIPLLVLFPAVVWLYVGLAHSEEKECLARFGSSYRRYLETVPGYFPAYDLRHARDLVPP